MVDKEEIRPSQSTTGLSSLWQMNFSKQDAIAETVATYMYIYTHKHVCIYIYTHILYVCFYIVYSIYISVYIHTCTNVYLYIYKIKIVCFASYG